MLILEGCCFVSASICQVDFPAIALTQATKSAMEEDRRTRALGLAARTCGIGGAASSSSISNQGREEACKTQGSLRVLAEGNFSSGFHALLMALFQSLSPNLLRALSISA